MDEVGRCKIANCNRLAKSTCVNSMCLKCCLQMDNSIKCPGHMAIKQKKEDEERYIEEGMNKRRKKTRDFLHVENRLQFYNQTVVIWCLEDFLRNKRWHEDTFTQLERIRRSKELEEKRRLARGVNIQVPTKKRKGSKKLRRRMNYLKLLEKYSQGGVQA